MSTGYCLACGHLASDIHGGICPSCRKDKAIREGRTKPEPPRLMRWWLSAEETRVRQHPKGEPSDWCYATLSPVLGKFVLDVIDGRHYD